MSDAGATRTTSPATPPATNPPATTWRRLHPLSPVVRTGRAFVPIVLFVLSALLATEDVRNLITHVVTLALVAGAGVVSWLVTRWRVEGGDLRVESGLFRRDSQRVPLARLQAVDVVRPGLARALGLAELRLRTAGDTGDSGRLAYLRLEEAERVRAQLLALAHGAAPDAPAPPEQPLFAQPPGRLLASVVLSRPFGVLVVLGAAVGLGSRFSAMAAAQLATGSLAYLLVAAVTVWRRFNGGWNLRVGQAADGVRLRFGALETTAETIPRGRVQALVLTRPLAWRLLGWCRVQLDVAGRVRGRQERQSDLRQLRTVVPAGTPAEATALLDRVLPHRPERLSRPPRRARLISPLRYHWLAVGWNGGSIAVRTGRVTETTVWVPLAKVQSLRLVQGPVQRRLQLATLHVDVAGRRLPATAHDRDEADARALFDQLAVACRQARQPLAPPPAQPAAPRT